MAVVVTVVAWGNEPEPLTLPFPECETVKSCETGEKTGVRVKLWSGMLSVVIDVLGFEIVAISPDQ